METEWSLELRFFLALALGLLVGIERESHALAKKSRVFSGLRTFTFAALLGFFAAWLHQRGLTGMHLAGFAAIALFGAIESVFKLRAGERNWVSLLALMLSYTNGMLCLLAPVWFPVALAVIVALLLSDKARLEALIEGLERNELLAGFKLMLLSLVILPLLPDQSLTRFAINPNKVWMFVVLVSGIGFVGYFISRRWGERAGLLLTGLVGGLASSTATTVSMGRIAANRPELGVMALNAALLSSAMVPVTLMVMLSVLVPPVAKALLVPLALALAANLMIAFWKRGQSGGAGSGGDLHLNNPLELAPALLFAGLLVLFMGLTAIAREFFGASALVILALTSGVVSVDSFVLPIADQAAQLGAWAHTLIFVSIFSNTVLKGIYFWRLAPGLQRETILRFGLLALVYLALTLALHASG